MSISRSHTLLEYELIIAYIEHIFCTREQINISFLQNPDKKAQNNIFE